MIDLKRMKLNILLILTVLTLLTSCNGQTTYQKSNTANFTKGDTVNEVGKNIMVIHQDIKNVYWFGSWETGIYRYDGKTIINYTTKDGLPGNRIDEIKSDLAGNIFINTSGGICQFTGQNFSLLPVITVSDWKLSASDLWFRNPSQSNYVFRYDGNTLHKLKLPNNPKFPISFEIYSIYNDSKGNIWFGTNPVGVCRYNGKSFQWIGEEDVTEFRNEGANGVRSITEDKNGDFWFNTESRYSVYDSSTLRSNKFYTRHKSIGSLDGKSESNLDEYLSTVRDNNNNLWFVTYRNGVWKYDGLKATHYTVQDNSKDITLFSIYKDNNGDLWLGTNENGAYKFNGTSFEKFK